jgi:hypothetical protein
MMVLCIENFITDTAFVEVFSELFRLLDAYGAYQNRLTFLVDFGNLITDGIELVIFIQEYDIVIIHPVYGTVGGYDDDVEMVYLSKLPGLGVCGARHARKFVIHAEIILECDCSQGSALAGGAHALLGFYGLVETVRVAPSMKNTPGEFIDDLNLTLLNNIILVTAEEPASLEGLSKVMYILEIFLIE